MINIVPCKFGSRFEIILTFKVSHQGRLGAGVVGRASMPTSELFILFWGPQISSMVNYRSWVWIGNHGYHICVSGNLVINILTAGVMDGMDLEPFKARSSYHRAQTLD